MVLKRPFVYTFLCVSWLAIKISMPKNDDKLAFYILIVRKKITAQFDININGFRYLFSVLIIFIMVKEAHISLQALIRAIQK